MREPLLALAILAAGFCAVWVWLRFRQHRFTRSGAADLVATYGVRPGGALVLAFTTPDCVPCKTVQRPVLAALERRFPGRIVVGEVDASGAHDLTARFGILTVPSTVVIAADGHVRAINTGTATADRLAAQIGLNGDVGGPGA